MLTRKIFIKITAIVSFIAVFSFGFKPKNSYASEAANEIIECTPGDEDCLEGGVDEDLLNTNASDDAADNAQTGPDGAAPGVDAENVSGTKADIDYLTGQLNAAQKEMESAHVIYIELSNKLVDDKNNAKLKQQLKEAKERYDAAIKSYDQSKEDLRRGASDTAGWNDYNIYAKPEQPQSKLSESKNFAAKKRLEETVKAKKTALTTARINLEKANVSLIKLTKEEKDKSQEYNVQLKSLKEAVDNSKNKVDRTASDLAEANRNVNAINKEINASLSELNKKYQDAVSLSEAKKNRLESFNVEIVNTKRLDINLINARKKAKRESYNADQAKDSAKKNLENAKQGLEGYASLKKAEVIQKSRQKDNNEAKDILKKAQNSYKEVNSDYSNFTLSVGKVIYAAKKEVSQSQQSFDKAQSQYNKAKQNVETAKKKEKNRSKANTGSSSKPGPDAKPNSENAGSNSKAGPDNAQSNSGDAGSSSKTGPDTKPNSGDTGSSSNSGPDAKPSSENVGSSSNPGPENAQSSSGDTGSGSNSGPEDTQSSSGNTGSSSKSGPDANSSSEGSRSSSKPDSKTEYVKSKNTQAGEVKPARGDRGKRYLYKQGKNITRGSLDIEASSNALSE